MQNLAPKVKNRYRVVDGKTSIELKLKTPHQLFDERDPAPFRERDLDDDAVRYIIDSYKGISTDAEDIKLSLYFAEMGTFRNEGDVIPKAIRAFFEYETELKHRELRETFREGFISLFIGLTFLLLCSWFSHSSYAESGLLQTFTKEWLMLMGWVSMWRPINIFLYEWWPIRETMKTMQELSQVEIEVHTADRAPYIEPTPELRRDAAVPIVFAGTLKSS
jgi:hypothetical protein